MELHKITTYQAGIMQATMHRKLQRFSDDILSQYGITKNHWLIIGVVRDHKPQGIRITELADILGTNMSYMTNTVNLLVSKDILTRDTHSKDNRSKIIQLTSKFDKKCNEIERELRTHLRKKVYAHVNDDDFQAYIRVIAKLSESDT